jgi:DNA repair protein RecO (recombination protein O)
MASHKTKAIVIRKTNYSETSLILQVLTPNDGLKSFIFQGAKRKNKKGNIVAPLAQLEIEYYQRNDSALAKISTIESTLIYKTIPFDPYKSSVVFFINEILQHTLKDNEKHEGLFPFLSNILEVLDLSDSIANFPIKFLYRYTKYLGFYPNEVPEARYLDLRECAYTKYQPNHNSYLSEFKTHLLLAFSTCDFDGINDPKIDLNTRRDLVYDLLKYYEEVIDNFKPVHSLGVLEATFHT